MSPDGPPLRRHLFVRLLLHLAPAQALLIAALAGSLMLHLAQSHEERLRSHWTSQCETLGTTISDLAGKGDRESVTRILRDLQSRHPERLDFAVFRPTGERLCPHDPAEVVPLRLDDVARETLNQGKQILDLEARASDGTRMGRVAMPIRRDGSVWAAARMDFGLDMEDRALRSQQVQIAGLALALLAVTTAGAFVFCRRIARPISALARAAERVSWGERDVRCEVQGQDELADVAIAFNSMVRSVQTANEDLRHSRASLECVFESMADALLVVETADDSGEVARIRSSNRAAQRLFGYGGAEFVGAPLARLIPRASGGDVLEESIALGTAVTNHEAVAVTRDGRSLEIRISLSRLDPGSAEPSGPASFVVVASDISALRAAERAKDASHRVALALHCAGTAREMFAAADHVLGAMLGNHGFTVHLAASPQEPLTSAFGREGHGFRPSNDAEISRLVRRVALCGTGFVLEREHLAGLTASDASRAPAPVGHLVAAPIRDRDRTLGVLTLYWLATSAAPGSDVCDLIDFTASQLAAGLVRRRAEDERVRLVSAIDHAPDTVMITGTDGTIRYANLAFETATGRTRAEAVGRRTEWIRNGDVAQDDAQMQAALQAGRSWTGRLQNRHAAGTPYVVEASVAAIRDPEGQIAALVWFEHDITREASLEEQLRQSQKLEAVGLLAGGVAHDFNNLLAVVTGYASLLADATTLTPDELGFVAEVRKASERAAQLTRQLLAFSRRQVMKPQVLHLGDVVREMCRLLKPLLGERITVRLAVAEKIGLVRADPGQVEQVFMNLAVNGRDAMRGGGVLYVAVEDRELTAHAVRDLPEVRPGRYVCLSVRDDGVGMDAATQKRIFEPFFTTKELGRGTGLGLSTVYGIVKQSGGHIEVESAPGAGSAFRVYLPIEADGACAAGERPAGPAPASGAGCTVLVAEDDVSIRTMTASLLRRSGYEVLEAADGRQALEIAATHEGPIDVLLSDVVMPGMSGRELARRIVLVRSGIALLFMSGYPGSEIATQGVLEPGTPYIEKPFQPPELLHRVRQLVKARSSSSPAPARSS